MTIGSTDYNEFKPEDRARIEALAKDLAGVQKWYLDKELRDFIRARVIIFIGEAGEYNAGSGVLDVRITLSDGPVTVPARGADPKIAKKVKGKKVRVLLDSLKKIFVFDDQYF